MNARALFPSSSLEPSAEARAKALTENAVALRWMDKSGRAGTPSHTLLDAYFYLLFAKDRLTYKQLQDKVRQELTPVQRMHVCLRFLDSEGVLREEAVRGFGSGGTARVNKSLQLARTMMDQDAKRIAPALLGVPKRSWQAMLCTSGGHDVTFLTDVSRYQVRHVTQVFQSLLRVLEDPHIDDFGRVCILKACKVLKVLQRVGDRAVVALPDVNITFPYPDMQNDLQIFNTSFLYRLLCEEYWLQGLQGLQGLFDERAAAAVKDRLIVMGSVGAFEAWLTDSTALAVFLIVWRMGQLLMQYRDLPPTVVDFAKKRIVTLLDSHATAYNKKEGGREGMTLTWPPLMTVTQVANHHEEWLRRQRPEPSKRRQAEHLFNTFLRYTFFWDCLDMRMQMAKFESRLSLQSIIPLLADSHVNNCAKRQRGDRLHRAAREFMEAFEYLKFEELGEEARMYLQKGGTRRHIYTRFLAVPK
jgi:hypothetical protein